MRNKYITFGIDRFDKNLFLKPYNSKLIAWNKPVGGLWCCEYHPENEFVSS